MTDMYENKLEGALPPVFKMIICPKCFRHLYYDISNYCPDCGTKLWIHVYTPEIKRPQD